MNWKNSYAICPYKEGKKPIPKIKRQNILTKRSEIYFRKIKR